MVKAKTISKADSNRLAELSKLRATVEKCPISLFREDSLKRIAEREKAILDLYRPKESWAKPH